MISVQLKGPGKASFNVTDVTNYLFSNRVNVSVQPVIDLDEILYVPIALYGENYEATDERSRRRPFDDCSKIKLNVEIVEKTRFTYLPGDEKKPLPGFKNSCKLQFKCTSIDDEIKQDLINSELIVDPYRYKKNLHVYRIERQKLGSSNLTREIPVSASSQVEIEPEVSQA